MARALILGATISVCAGAVPPGEGAGGQASARQADTLAGTWTGALGNGEAKLRVVVTIAQSGDGVYTGQLNSVDQNSVIPITGIVLVAREVRFEAPSVQAKFRGKIDAAGNTITGTWTQEDGPQPLTLRRVD